MNATDILRRINLLMDKRAQEDEWNKRLNMVSDEILTIASCYEKWLTLNDMLNGQNAFYDFCAEFGYSPSIPQSAIYYAVTELREIADKRALEAVGEFPQKEE